MAEIDIEGPECVGIPLPLDTDTIERLCADGRRYRRETPQPLWNADELITRTERVDLVLYVSARSTASARAIRTLTEILRDVPSARVRLTIVDVAFDAAAAAADRVLFTPTLMYQGRGPRVRVLGDLSNRAVLLDLLRSAGIDAL